MKNKEKYAKEIVEIAIYNGSFGVDKTTGVPTDCDSVGFHCEDCLFNKTDDCNVPRRKWANEDYVKPQKFEFTKLEKTILSNVSDKYNYIARDSGGQLKLFANKPKNEIIPLFGGVWTSESIKTIFPYEHLFKCIIWDNKQPCEFRKFLED